MLKFKHWPSKIYHENNIATKLNNVRSIILRIRSVFPLLLFFGHKYNFTEHLKIYILPTFLTNYKKKIQEKKVKTYTQIFYQHMYIKTSCLHRCQEIKGFEATKQ